MAETAETHKPARRLETVYRTANCFVLISILAASAAAQIAYVKHRAVFVLPCDKTGLPQRGAISIKVSDLWPDQDDTIYDSIGWVAPGKIWLIHDAAKAGSDSKQSIYLVDAKARMKLIKLADGCEPAFSPDGTTMAYATSDFNGDIWLLDLRSGKRTLKVRHAEQPAWSGDGKSFVYIARDKDLNGVVTIRNYSDWKSIRTLRPQVSPDLIFLSRDASKIAVEFSLSRPKMGHTIFDLKRGSDVTLAGPDRFAPPEIDDWSPDEAHLLSSYRMIDPDNDGTWIQNQLGVTDIDGNRLKLLSIGYQGRFSPDGRHILYITDHKTGMFNRRGDLVWQSLQDGSKRTLVRKVTDYSVFRRR